MSNYAKCNISRLEKDVIELKGSPIITSGWQIGPVRFVPILNQFTNPKRSIRIRSVQLQTCLYGGLVVGSWTGLPKPRSPAIEI